VNFFVQHLLLLPTLLTVSVLTIVLRAWRLTTFVAGAAFAIGVGVIWWGLSVVILTWTLGALLLVGAANVIIVAAGPPDPTSAKTSASRSTPPGRWR
jgi:hypothetical protein